MTKLIKYSLMLVLAVAAFATPFVFRKECDTVFMTTMKFCVETGDATREYIDSFFVEGVSDGNSSTTPASTTPGEEGR